MTFASGVAGQPFDFNQAFDLNGTNGYVDVPWASSLTPTSAISVDAWINLTALPSASGTGGWDVFNDFYDGGHNPLAGQNSGGAGAYDLRVMSDGSVKFSVGTSESFPYYTTVQSAAGLVTPGTFVQVAGSYDSGTGQLTVYVNGVATTTIASGTLNQDHIALKIGADLYNQRYFQGVIDEPAVFDRALAPSEIQRIYQVGSLGLTSYFGNGNDGVYVNGGAAYNTIGGLTGTPGTGAGNVISGNGYAGIELFADHNTVLGNLVGTDASGTKAVGNAYSGVLVEGSDNTVGGTSPDARNVLSATRIAGVNYLIASGVAIWDGNYLTTANNVVEGNYLGTDITGTVALGNAWSGAAVEASTPGSIDNVIGGSTPGAGNLISGNDGPSAQAGVFIGQSQDVTVEGNRIGTNAAGTAALPNSRGISVWAGESNVTIGGVSTTSGGELSGAGNLISGNANTGILLIGSANVYGNWIGTDVTGTTALPNQSNGISFDGNNSVIGGVGLGNVISGNTNDGVLISNGSSGIVVHGNLIGTNAAGTSAVPNTADGVAISSYGANTDNTIGGTVPGTGNVISGNSGDGVDIQGSGTTGNVVEANTITHNIGDGVFINGASGNTIGVTGSPNSISGNSGAGIEVSGASANIVGDGSTSLSVDAATTATLATSSVTVNSLTVSYSGISALTTSGNADLNDPSGTLTGLNSLTVTGSTAIEAGTNVTTSGAQTYGHAVTLGANTILTGSTVTAQSTVVGAGHSLAVSGNAAFDGEATGFSTLSVSGITAVNTDLVSTSGADLHRSCFYHGAGDGPHLHRLRQYHV